MKKSLFILMLMMFVNTIFAAASQSITLPFSDAISITSKNVETGKKLTFKEKIAFKKEFKERTNTKESQISKGLYILLAIIGLGWLGMGILDDFEGEKWIISLLLYWFGGLPGLIYTLIKMKDYYQ
ncbi:MAG: hypothetical protein HC803_07005 [Saprospiraceae bacterium]|nr:hypothetical protein [Saprospiraceae bacterium]